MTVSRCVVFDLDDTLFLERAYVRSGFAAVGAWAEAALGIRAFGCKAWGEFEQGMRGTIFQTVLLQHGVQPVPELISHMVDLYRRHEPDIGLLPDARACIEQLRDRVNLAVVTDGPSASQRAKAVAVGAYRWARPVILTADLGPGAAKPSPEGFALVEEVSGLTGTACAYVADNPTKDFAGPRFRGWLTVRVRRPEGLHTALPGGVDVDIDVSDLSQLPARLEPWLGGDERP